MASNARNLSKLLGTSTQVPTTALPPAIADLETVGQTLSGGEIVPSSIKSNTLTQSFDSNQAVTFNMADSIDAVSPIVSVFKEVPQAGFSSKGQWDVNANATNYDFYDEKPISYSSANLTPSATGDGTFTNSAANTTYYDVANATYDNVSNAQYTSFTGAYSTIFNNNGTKAYVTAHNSSGGIYQYSLSTAYDVSTNTYDSKTYAFSQFTYPTASRFNGDGTKLYTVAWNGSASSSRIWQYSLSTAYDISTASYDSVNLNLTAHNFAWGFTFNNDGSKVFVSIVDGGATGGRIAEYSLSTNYDLSTAGSQTLYVLSGTGWANYGIEFNNDGTKLFVNNNDDVPTKGPHVFTLSTAYDISTVSYTSTNADVNTLFGGSMGAGDITFNNNGSKMYISDTVNGYVRQFSVSTSTAFSASDVGKKVIGNSGSAIITATSGTYKSVTPFADTSAISSWTLTSSQGKADGTGIELSGYSVAADIVFPTGASGSGASMVYNNNVSPTSNAFNNLRNVVFNPTGTIALVMTSGNIQRWNLSTAFDLATMTEATGDNFSGQLNSTQYGLAVSPDGTKLFVGDHGSDVIKQFTLSTPWSPSTESYNGYYYLNNGGNWNSFSGADGLPSTTNFNPFSFQFNSDGTKMICTLFDNVPYHSVVEFALSTGFDMSTLSYTSFANFDGNVDPEAIVISPDGLKIMMHGSGLGDGGIEVYSLPSAFSVGNSGNSLTKTSGTMDLSTLTGNSSSTITLGGLSMSSDGKRMWAIYSSDNKFYEITGGTTSVHPYSTYSPALTNSSTGQINSSTWTDINSMTADETKNDGDVFYAVSTDNRTSWSVAKGSDGVRKIAKNNSGTWQYNNNTGSSTAVGFSLASPSYDNKSYSVSHSNPRGMYLKPDGTELYIGAYTGHVYQYTLSTPNDISTASSTGNYNIDEVYDTVALTFKPDGTKMYATGGTDVYQYTLSTAWDITTASYDSVSYTPSDMGSSNIHSLNFNSDGTKLFMSDDGSSDKRIREYSLSTPYVISSASTTSNYLYHNKANVRGVDFNSDGTKIFLSSYSTQTVYQYNLASPYTLSSSQGTTADAEYDASSTISSGMYSMAFSNDGTKLFILESNTDTVKQFSTTTTALGYGTGETWVDGTNNNEHATLQEALGAQSFNRMDKAQLDAVADGYHFSQDSADTLDLMIAPYAASGASPVSDGVTINYDAEAIVREAIPGTDYIADFPNPTTLNITAVGAANLKIRAQ
jgi:hypothetical protein